MILPLTHKYTKLLTGYPCPKTKVHIPVGSYQAAQKKETDKTVPEILMKRLVTSLNTKLAFIPNKKGR